MLSYPARMARDGEGFVVSFPDIPEALTSGASREEALVMAADALTTAMDFYFEDRRPVPAPTDVCRTKQRVRPLHRRVRQPQTRETHRILLLHPQPVRAAQPPGAGTRAIADGGGPL